MNEENAGTVPDADAPGGGFGYPRAVRIVVGDEILALLRRGKRRRTRHLDVFVSASPVSHARWGIVAPKPRGKHQKGGRARAAGVQRNRLKRRLREIGRTLVLPRLRNAGLAIDVLVRARPEAYGAGFDELRAELTQLTEELCSRAP